jgi:hypothetical protein
MIILFLIRKIPVLIINWIQIYLDIMSQLIASCHDRRISALHHDRIFCVQFVIGIGNLSYKVKFRPVFYWVINTNGTYDKLLEV